MIHADTQAALVKAVIGAVAVLAATASPVPAQSRSWPPPAVRPVLRAETAGAHPSRPRRLTVRLERDAFPRDAGRRAAPIGVAVGPGLVFETPFTLVAGVPNEVVRVPRYLGPDGTYDSLADLTRSINGTPCGQACTRRSLERWGYAPVGWGREGPVGVR